MLLQQIKAGQKKVENQYKRAVPWEGNRAALKAMAEVFELRPYFEWRGMGFISQSALKIRDTYAEWDAEPLSCAWRPRHRSKSGTMRRSAEGRAQARAVQAIRQRMHSGTACGRADGFIRGFLRGLL